MRLSLGISLKRGAGTRVQVGPLQTAIPSVSPGNAVEDTLETRTQGTYTARGGGSVSITTSEWRVDGVQVSTAATYTPVTGDVGGVLTYFEVATETGGTAPGARSSQITLGTVQAALGANAILDMAGNVITDMGGNPILDMAG